MNRSSLESNRRRFLKQFAFGTAMFTTPGLFAEELIRTPRQTEGPFYPDKLPLDTDNDLLIINDGITPAVGEITHLTGRVLDVKGEPVRNAAVEIWQVDNHGSYIHTRGDNNGKRDSNFQGFGRFVTNRKGEYYFRTIKPVPYPGRTPHVHVAVNKGGKRMLTTQFYVKGDARNSRDFIYKSVRDPKVRDSITVDFKAIKDSKLGELQAKFDIGAPLTTSAMPLLKTTALVTGGGRGIGRAIAVAFAQAGADVAVTARSRHEIESVAEEIRETGRRSMAVVCDVTDSAGVSAMVESVADELGPVTLLVNNAGGGLERKPVGEDDPDTWRQTIDVNLFGTYLCSRAVLPGMKAAGGGKIVNIGSGMGYQARSNNSSYNAAKAAVAMFGKCLATEVWDDNICVNELIPGPVSTQLTAGIFEADAPHPQFASEWVKRPADVVPMAMFLATQPDRGPTGQVFSIARRPF
eukprot:g26586.t1